MLRFSLRESQTTSRRRTFSTDGFQDGYGELDHAGTGDTRRRPRKSPPKMNIV